MIPATRTEPTLTVSSMTSSLDWNPSERSALGLAIRTTVSSESAVLSS